VCSLIRASVSSLLYDRREICNCGRPCVGRVVKKSTFQKHRRLQKCFEAFEAADLTWLRPAKAAKKASPKHGPTNSQLPDEPCLAQSSKSGLDSVKDIKEGEIDDVSLLHTITLQLVSADTAIHLISADLLVLEQHRGHPRLLHGHPKNAMFELHEENISIVLLRLAQVQPTSQASVELRSNMIEWAQGLEAYLALLLNGAISQELLSQNERARHLHSRNTG